MNKFKVTTARWANWGDLDLPLYRRWNAENPLPPSFWQRVWEYPFAVSHVPRDCRSLDVGGTYPFVLLKNFPGALSVDVRDLNELDHPLHKGLWPSGRLVVADATSLPQANAEFDVTMCISALEEMPDPIAVVREMLRVTRDKLVITLDISESLGMKWEELLELCRLLDFEPPPIPADRLVSDDRRLRKLGIKPTAEYNHIRVLGLVIEDEGPSKQSCGIIVPHWESHAFLDACIRKIDEQRSDSLRQHVYIVDDDSADGSLESIRDRWSGRDDVTILEPHRSNRDVPDVGLLLDHALERVSERYVCMIDADVLPISPYWLSFPIHLLDKYGCSSVGCDTGLSNAYMKMKLCPGRWQNEAGYSLGFALFDNENFTCTNNFYRVMKTSLAKVVSEQIGFSRQTTHMPASTAGKALRRAKRELQRITPGDYCPAGCDNGVAANHFIDINKLGPKLNIPLTSWVASTPRDGVFGQNVCGLVFHFALSTRALSRRRREIDDPGEVYRRYGETIATDGLTDELLDELLGRCVSTPSWSDPSISEDWYKAQRASFDRALAEFVATSEPGR